ncbi:MAG: class I SAM-dependent methyltransferase [Streptosporangiaceae bacterium]
MSIYDDPGAYELACAFREVPPEVDALLAWSARYGLAPVHSVLELAAGPAEHSREFARRGIEVTALDLSPAMCRYAGGQAARTGLAFEIVEADMTRFDLGRRFDLVITMLDSTSHLMTLDALVAHFDRAAAHVAAGGLYILEMNHPRDRLTDDPSVSTSWEVERDGVRADVRWGEPGDLMDPITQISDDRVTISISEPPARDGGPRRTRVVEDVVPYRFWTATELTAAVRLAAALHPVNALEIVAQYGEFAVAPDVAVTDPEAWRLITVLRPVG